VELDLEGRPGRGEEIAAGGMYFLRVTADGRTASRKIVRLD